MKRLFTVVLTVGLLLPMGGCDGFGTSESDRIIVYTQSSTTPAASSTVTKATMPVVTEPEKVGTDYIVNTNTGKFHYHDCTSADQMAEHNKWEYNGDIKINGR